MNEDKKIFIPKIGLIFLVIFSALLFLLIREQNTLFNIYNNFILNKNTIIILSTICILFFILWSYCILSVLKNSFKKDSDKIAWIIVLIIIPPTALFYFDIKEQQITNEEIKNDTE